MGIKFLFIPRLIIGRYADNQVFKGTALKRYRLQWYIFGWQIRIDFDKWGLEDDIK